jgi:hypothetical protein
MAEALLLHILPAHAGQQRRAAAPVAGAHRHGPLCAASVLSHARRPLRSAYGVNCRQPIGTAESLSSNMLPRSRRRQRQPAGHRQEMQRCNPSRARTHAHGHQPGFDHPPQIEIESTTGLQKAPSSRPGRTSPRVRTAALLSGSHCQEKPDGAKICRHLRSLCPSEF